MLKFMRTHATSWFIKIILTLIIVVFVLWGMGSIKGKKETIVATVGGDYITRVEFDRAYRNVEDNYKRIFRGQLPPDFLKGLNIKQQVLDQLIDSRVKQKEAHNMGLGMGDKELRDVIMQNPAFQRDGQFDGYLYEQFLRNIGSDTATFPSLLKRELMNQRLGALIGDAAVILTDEEVKDLYFLESAKINLSYVVLSPQAFARQIKVTQGDLERYYAEHKAEFQTPAQVRVIYLRFSPDAYLKEVVVSPQEVQDEYALNEGKKRALEEVRKEITTRLLKEKARYRAAMQAADASYQAKKKGGLKAYAAEARLPVQAAGPFKAGEFLKGGGLTERLASIAFTLDANEVSSAFQQGEDSFVLQVVEKNPPQIPPLERVRGEIAAAFVSSMARGLVQGTARDLLTAWRKGEGFGELLRRNGLKIAETGFFPRSSASLPGIGPLGAFAGKIATLTLEDPWPDDIAEVNGASIVIRLQGIERVDARRYEAEKETFRKRLGGYKGLQLQQGLLTVLKKEAKIDINQEILGEYR